MFIKNVFSNSIYNAYGQGIRAIQEFVLRILLPPETLGIWSYILVTLNFGRSLDMGVQTAAMRELPILYGKEDKTGVASTKKSTLVLQLLTKGIAGIGIALYAIFQNPNNSSWMLWGGVCAGIMLFLSGIGELFVGFYQSAQQYQELSKKMVVYWTLSGICIVFGAYYASILGIILGNIAAFLIQIYLLRHCCKNFRFKSGESIWDWKLKKSLLSFAIPLIAVDYPMSLIPIIDSYFVATYLGLKELAIYSTAKLIVNQAAQIPAWSGSVLIIRLTTYLDPLSKGRPNLEKETFHNLLVLYLVVLPLLILFVYYGSVFLAKYYLVKYIDVVMVLPPLLFSLYVTPNVTVIRNFWIIQKQFKKIAGSNIICLFMLCIFLFYLFITNQISLVSVSLAFSSASTIYFLYILLTLGSEIWNKKERSTVFFSLLASTILLMAALYLPRNFVLLRSASPYIELFFQLCISLIMISPLVVFGLYRTKLLSHLKKGLRRG